MSTIMSHSTMQNSQHLPPLHHHHTQHHDHARHVYLPPAGASMPASHNSSNGASTSHQNHQNHQSHPNHHAQHQDQPQAHGQTNGHSQQDPGTTVSTKPRSSVPVSLSQVRNGWKYELQVLQQPQRARMCGFGDKDRRPITPPPCVRLVLTDVKTGLEIDCNHIDYGGYVLSVDLWNQDGSEEVNLVRSTTSQPSISNTTAIAYDNIALSVMNPPGPSPTQSHQSQPSSSYSQIAGYGGQPSIPGTYSGPPHAGQQQPQQQQQLPRPHYPSYGGGYSNSYHQGGPQSAHPPPPQPAAPHGPPTTYNGYDRYGGYGGAMAHVPSQTTSPTAFRPPTQFDPMGARTMSNATTLPGTYTRNLIGSLAASAFRLADCDDKQGIWFVLQDLSVRTEGSFRLRFSFVDVGPYGPSGTTKQSAPVLAACFSDEFQVFSAKKFPGVCESTELSKCFAVQGMKIPIRKEGQGDKNDDDC